MQFFFSAILLPFYHFAATEKPGGGEQKPHNGSDYFFQYPWVVANPAAFQWQFTGQFQSGLLQYY